MSKWYIWVHMDWIGFTCSCYKFEKNNFLWNSSASATDHMFFGRRSHQSGGTFNDPLRTASFHNFSRRARCPWRPPWPGNRGWTWQLEIIMISGYSSMHGRLLHPGKKVLSGSLSRPPSLFLSFFLSFSGMAPCRLTLSLRDRLLATLFLTAAPVMDSRELRIERRQKMFKKSCQSPQPTFTTSRETSLPSRSWSPILQGANLITHGLGRGMDGPIVILGIVDSKLGPQGERRWWKSVERISDQHVLQNRVWVYSTLAAGWNHPKYIKYYQVITRSLRPSLDASGDAHFLKPSVNALVAPAVLQRIVPQISRPVLGQTDAFKVWRLLLRYSS